MTSTDTIAANKGRDYMRSRSRRPVQSLDAVVGDSDGPGHAAQLQSSGDTAPEQVNENELRERVRFVSISLDPEYDTPEVLTRYAQERGADLATWSFLTGPPAEVADVVKRFGVGTLRAADGSIDHVVATFLIDEQGRIAKRWLGLENGVNAFSIVSVRDIPLVVETGILLDAFVAVFLMGVAVYHIRREFDHIDADQMNALKG